MTPVTIRQAVFADVECIAPLFDDYRQFYEKSSDLQAARSFLAERFNHGESIVFIAEENHFPVGFTQLYPSFSSVSLRRVFIVNDLFVASSHRRKGVGSMLIQAAVEYSRSLGAVRVSLNTDIKNTSAQRMYKAEGWKQDQEYYAFHFKL